MSLHAVLLVGVSLMSSAADPPRPFDVCSATADAFHARCLERKPESSSLAWDADLCFLASDTWGWDCATADPAELLDFYIERREPDALRACLTEAAKSALRCTARCELAAEASERCEDRCKTMLALRKEDCKLTKGDILSR